MNTKDKEELLYAWIGMTTSIRGNRIVSEASFNETVICGLLYYTEDNASKGLTAKELGNRTNILKSQINRTVNSLLKKGYVTTTRDATDKRSIRIIITPEGIEFHQREHARIMQFVDYIAENMGEAKVQKFSRLMSEAVALARDWKN